MVTLTNKQAALCRMALLREIDDLQSYLSDLSWKPMQAQVQEAIDDRKAVIAIIEAVINKPKGI